MTRLLQIAAGLTLVGLVLMVWSMLAPTPLPVILAMSVGQLVGTVAFGMFGYAVLVDQLRKQRAKGAKRARAAASARANGSSSEAAARSSSEAAAGSSSEAAARSSSEAAAGSSSEAAAGSSSEAAAGPSSEAAP